MVEEMKKLFISFSKRMLMLQYFELVLASIPVLKAET